MNQNILTWSRRISCGIIFGALLFALANARDQARATTDMTARERYSVDFILTLALAGATIGAHAAIEQYNRVRPYYRERSRYNAELERTTSRTETIRHRLKAATATRDAHADQRARMAAAHRERFEHTRTGMPLPVSPNEPEGS